MTKIAAKRRLDLIRTARAWRVFRDTRADDGTRNHEGEPFQSSFTVLGVWTNKLPAMGEVRKLIRMGKGDSIIVRLEERLSH
jgi:hypothetical protein